MNDVLSMGTDYLPSNYSTTSSTGGLLLLGKVSILGAKFLQSVKQNWEIK